MKRTSSLNEMRIPKSGFIVMNPDDEDLKYYCSTKKTSKGRFSYWTDKPSQSKIYEKESVAKGSITRLQKKSKDKNLKVVSIEEFKIKTYYYDIFLNKIESEYIFEDRLERSESNFLTEKEAFVGELMHLRKYGASLKLSIMKNQGLIKDLEKSISEC